jgi:predicted ATP-grasp superfamily ATP-dependent carboligase
MAAATSKPSPWLIAAWPGMGNVAVIAAGYLVQQFQMKESGELPSRDHFDVNEVDVKGGLVGPIRLPRGMFFHWKNPRAEGRDLIVFLAEAQPTTGACAYAHELVEEASRRGVERVITFAAMASGLHPAESPKVTGVTTDADTLTELRRAEVEPLADGEIGGLNGVVLAVAAERGMRGLCLLAEIPFFAARVPNPKAARAALSVFSVLAEIDISLEELNRHAAAVDRALIEALKKIERNQEEEEGSAETGQAEPPPVPEQGGAPEERREAPDQGKLDYAARNRIEQLFEEARKDQGKAVALKDELERLGVFKRYEDRFLDLFRRAG